LKPLRANAQRARNRCTFISGRDKPLPQLATKAIGFRLNRQSAAEVGPRRSIVVLRFCCDSRRFGGNDAIQRTAIVRTDSGRKHGATD
jgi:hypothetical protein